jgi:hypothetical protein
MCSYSRNRRRISRWGCEQENQGSEIDAAHLSPGCSMGCSTWRQEASQHLPYLPRFTCKLALFESRRADSNRLPLLQLRVIGHVLQVCAGDCKCRISTRLSLLRFAPCCTVLRSRWYQQRHGCLMIVLGCGRKETPAACIASLTNEGSWLLGASITSHA